MQGWIGWDDAGHVDRLGNESVATEFFHAVIPVWPSRTSIYKLVTPAGEETELQIPRDRRSVLLGLLRTPSWIAAMIVGLPPLFDYARWAYLLPFGLAIAAIAAWLTFVAGRLHHHERARRELLKRVSGMGVPPELLPEAMRTDLCEEIADRWFREFQTDWRDAIYAGVASEILVALAEYHRAPQLLIRARTNLIDRGGN
jgi:hypothetical protein